MCLVVLSILFLCGLEDERLTLAATFFFISLCPYGQHRNSGKPRLWKSWETASLKHRAALGEQPFLYAETLDESTAPKVVQTT
jgi:hypothetical protein